MVKQKLTRKEVMQECVPVKIPVFRGRPAHCYARIRRYIYTPADEKLEIDYDLYDNNGFYSPELSDLADRENAWEDIDRQIFNHHQGASHED